MRALAVIGFRKQVWHMRRGDGAAARVKGHCLRLEGLASASYPNGPGREA
jgi:hypothetical protein